MSSPRPYFLFEFLTIWRLHDKAMSRVMHRVSWRTLKSKLISIPIVYNFFLCFEQFWEKNRFSNQIEDLGNGSNLDQIYIRERMFWEKISKYTYMGMRDGKFLPDIRLFYRISGIRREKQIRPIQDKWIGTAFLHHEKWKFLLSLTFLWKKYVFFSES